MTKKLFAVVAVILAGAAWAAAEGTFDRFAEFKPIVFIKGIYIGPDTGPSKVQATTTNKVTRSLGASATIDFVAGTIICTDSVAISVPGAAVNDPCFVGAPAAPAADSTFTCYVSATDNVKVRHCPAGTAVDPASAVYKIRVVSNN